jgi:hypothetical protein
LLVWWGKSGLYEEEQEAQNKIRQIFVSKQENADSSIPIVQGARLAKEKTSQRPGGEIPGPAVNATKIGPSA